MACFPVLAQAEENSGIQYEPEVPTVPTHQSSNIPSGKNQDSSNSSNPKAHQSDSEATGGSAGGKDKSGTGGAHSGQGNQAQGGNGDKSGSGSQGAGDSGVTNAKQVSSLESPAESSDGGSSPLVPILIAIVVLAAISIGAYYYRQRRNGSDTPASPSAS